MLDTNFVINQTRLCGPRNFTGEPGINIIDTVLFLLFNIYIYKNEECTICHLGKMTMTMANTDICLHQYGLHPTLPALFLCSCTDFSDIFSMSVACSQVRQDSSDKGFGQG